MKTVVIALGGNALLDPSGKQSFSMENENIGRVSKSIAELCKNRNYRVVITHGNGSQVGDELMRNEHAKMQVPKLPLYILNAETQALIGSILETSLRNSLNAMKVRRSVCVILAHVLVDKEDGAFRNPSKQIGPFYGNKELGRELALGRFDYIKSGSKYRRVVSSPKPKGILELDPIKSEVSRHIVITCGGGGIPTVRKGKMFYGIDAVIDKDLTTQLLANSINAEKMIILTNTDYVYGNYGKHANRIKEVRASTIKRRLEKFENGTIRPKIEACVRFIENGGKEAYIGDVFSLDAILKRKSGTMIH
ncbi:MAG: carbamate kinase [Candidatus Micrarchaeota archaeon]|nr:carbamate kinase [Candidatus Micrarchaeota archaeon]